MKSKREKGRTWDGKSRVVNDLYRKNFDEIFGEKTEEDIEKENEEYLEAAKNNDIVEVADALGDMLYILCGTIIEHGMQHKIETVFEEIQRSNMSKLGEDGKPIFREDGKVLKGPNYFKPNIKQILES